MESEGNKKILTIQRGREQGVHPSDEMVSPKSLLHSAYCQAMQATKEIVKQTSRFHCCCKPGAGGSLGNQGVLSNCLFSYSNNIIAFSAPRGGGKTHTMLSFARILQDKKYTDKELKDINFYIIPPICPSILEKGQNALHIILSRLYSYAEEELFHQRTKRFFYEDEELERKLYGAFHRCLLGQNGLKFPAKEPVDDFSTLQVTGDGIALQQHFYELIQNILAIVTGNGTPQDSYLVLQLDDTDSQIDRSYEVFEDIRKYLQIPNLIILMSVDMEVMLDVVLEKYLGQFFNLSQSRLGVGPRTDDMERELSRICQKYIDKLIPPSHLVQIISLEKCLESYGECLELRYCYDDKNEQAVFRWPGDVHWSAEITVLMLIFRKTGVIFTKPKSYIHNIVPTTYRGLNQLLFLLSTMEDVPEMTADGASSGAAIDTVDGFVQALSRQIPVLARNLELFSNYFINSWVSAKIKLADDRAFLRELQQIAPKYRVAVVLDYLAKRYPDQEYLAARSPEYIVMEWCIKELLKIHRTQEDLLLFFAIHTIFTLESHRTVLRKKREGVLRYEDGSNRPLVFDYDPKSTALPLPCLLDEHLQVQEFTVYRRKIRVKNGGNYYKTFKKRFFTFLKEFKSNSNGSSELIWDCLTCTDESGEPALNFANFITLLLRLGAAPLNIGEVDEEKPVATEEEKLDLQRRAYQMQEAALLIATNWDVQYRLRKLKGLEADSSAPTDGAAENQLATLYAGFDNVLCTINGGALKDYINKKITVLGVPAESEGTAGNKISWGVEAAFQRCMMPDFAPGRIAISQRIDLDYMLKKIITGNGLQKNPRRSEKTLKLNEPPSNPDKQDASINEASEVNSGNGNKNP